jgi:hypothetical protein
MKRFHIFSSYEINVHSVSGNQYRILSLIINLPYCVNVFETNYGIMDVTVCPLLETVLD